MHTALLASRLMKYSDRQISLYLHRRALVLQCHYLFVKQNTSILVTQIINHTSIHWLYHACSIGRQEYQLYILADEENDILAECAEIVDN